MGEIRNVLLQQHQPRFNVTKKNKKILTKNLDRKTHLLLQVQHAFD